MLSLEVCNIYQIMWNTGGISSNVCAKSKIDSKGHNSGPKSRKIENTDFQRFSDFHAGEKRFQLKLFFLKSH